MSTVAKASPDITRAAERYLEQYGDPLVMNTYFKVTVLVLCAVAWRWRRLLTRVSKRSRMCTP